MTAVLRVNWLKLTFFGIISFCIASLVLFSTQHLKTTLNGISNTHSVDEKQSDDVAIDDVTITIKTTQRFHESRIELLLKTWMKRVVNQVRTDFRK